MSKPIPETDSGEATTNQCDGCRRGMPLYHMADDFYDMIGCTRDRYLPSSPPPAELSELLDRLMSRSNIVGTTKSDSLANTALAEYTEVRAAILSLFASQAEEIRKLKEERLTSNDLGFILSGEYGPRTCPCQYCVALSKKIDGLLRASQ